MTQLLEPSRPHPQKLSAQAYRPCEQLGPRRLSHWILATGTLAICLTQGEPARAEWFHPDLQRASTALERARGPEAYTAAREIWGSWLRTNPDHVEQLLLLSAQNKRLSPSVRAYTGTLAAYARSRRGDLQDTKQRIRELGYVVEWTAVGPFDNEGKAGLDQVFEPELEFATGIIPGRAYTGKQRPVRWRTPTANFPYGFITLGSLFRPEQKICGYVTSFVKSKADRAKEISLWVGASGGFKLFWNGRQVLKDPAYRGYDAERWATNVKLEKGYNNLTLKVCGDGSAPVASVRLGDATGNPDPDLSHSNSQEHSKQAAQHAPEKVEELTPKGVQGAVQLFEKLIQNKPKAADLYAYAKYLQLTDGDDAKEHWARDYARRAAEEEPTVERLLLAGELSENRNSYAEWLKKAEGIAENKSIPVLLGRADLLQSSPAWRQAIPYYDRVLELDPDNLEGLQGRVEMYNNAGLKQTALASLERAAERNPESVNLLNMYASQLHALGRTSEAQAVESRYFSRNIDDSSYISQQLNLAINRRDKQSAWHWAERLLELDPGSLWSHRAYAETRQLMGQPQEAIAAYKKALELAPEDVDILRSLADLYAEIGNREEQLVLLQQILQLRPQDQAVRQYVEHIEPPKARADEAYAVASKTFLKERLAPAQGENRRTLVNLTVTTVFENGLSSNFHQVVFQPLTDSSAAVSRQYAFHYQADRQRVQLRGAKVYRADGSIDEAIESGEAAADNPSIAMYTSGRTYYVQFPRLDPGDVVELRYRVDDITPNNEFADYFGSVEYLQSSEPIGHAEYVLIAPKSRKLHIDVVGLPELKRQEQTKGDQKIYRFSVKNSPSIVPEPAMPPWTEVLGFVHVSTFKDWQDMGRWYWGLAKDQFDLDDETRTLVRKIAEGKTDKLDQVRAVYDWVTKNTRYVALEFGIYGYKPRRCVQTVARGWGDCKDKSTVIVSMLKELGIESTIVILRTQMRGDFSSKVASLAPFDHAIVYVPEFKLYLDGTAEYASASELPSMDLNSMGLLVNEGKSQLVRLPGIDVEQSVRKRSVSAVVDKSGSAELSMAYETKGSAAPSWRRHYHAEATQRERVERSISQEFPGIVLLPGKLGLSTNDLEDVNQPVSLKLKGKAPGFARTENNRLSMAVTTNYRLTPNFASLSKRTLDVSLPDLGTTEDTFTVQLPQGAKVIAMPQSVKRESPFGSYEVLAEQSGNQVKVYSRLSIKAAKIRPSEYTEWKKFCAEADSAFAGRLVVEQ